MVQMNARTQITLDSEMQRQARRKAAELGISFAEYVRRLVARDLGSLRPRKADISILFDLIGPETNIARDKDKMIGDAVWDEHRRKTTRTRAHVRLKTKE